MKKVNVMEHELVPEHYLLSEEEEKGILEKLQITKDSLPKIKRSDPVVKILEKIYGPIKHGRIQQGLQKKMNQVS